MKIIDECRNLEMTLMLLFIDINTKYIYYIRNNQGNKMTRHNTQDRINNLSVKILSTK